MIAKKRIVAFLGILTLVSSPLMAQEKTEFENPVVLKADNEVLNSNNRMMYPSPAIFDIDNDGSDELVIGTIFGDIFACKNQSTESSEPVWSQPTAVQSVEGTPLKLNNW